jgi:hypothetical protein
MFNLFLGSSTPTFWKDGIRASGMCVYVSTPFLHTYRIVQTTTHKDIKNLCVYTIPLHGDRELLNTRSTIPV